MPCSWSRGDPGRRGVAQATNEESSRFDGVKTILTQDGRVVGGAIHGYSDNAQRSGWAGIAPAMADESSRGRVAIGITDRAQARGEAGRQEGWSDGP